MKLITTRCHGSKFKRQWWHLMTRSRSSVQRSRSGSDGHRNIVNSMVLEWPTAFESKLLQILNKPYLGHVLIGCWRSWVQRSRTHVKRFPADAYWWTVHRWIPFSCFIITTVISVIYICCKLCVTNPVYVNKGLLFCCCAFINWSLIYYCKPWNATLKVYQGLDPYSWTLNIDTNILPISPQL